jgi:hypothetical protein
MQGTKAIEGAKAHRGNKLSIESGPIENPPAVGKAMEGAKAHRGVKLSIESGPIENPPVGQAPSGKPSSHDEGARMGQHSRHNENPSMLRERKKGLKCKHLHLRDLKLRR